jgi:hypothetical protein
MEYYAELLARGRVDLLPKIIEHLQECPHCGVQYREALRRLVPSQSETSNTSDSDLTEPYKS